MQNSTKTIILIMSLLLVTGVGTSVTNAKSFKRIAKQDHKIGKLSKNRAGQLGWIVSSGEKKYFCNMKAATAYVGKSGLVSFTSSGRQIKSNRKAFEAYIGGPDKTIPQLSDLKAGRPKERDVASVFH